MWISKHHYAVELARGGNKVFFLNPPSQGGIGKSQISILPHSEVPNLWIIEHSIWFPFFLKFHFIWLFHWLMRFQIKRVLAQMGVSPEIVWSFDLGDIYPFKLFPRHSLKVFHPVDEPLNETALNAGIGADVIFSVTPEILEKYANLNVPAFWINHGVSEVFFSRTFPVPREDAKVRVGYSGNLMRPDIDRETLLTIIRENKGLEFHFFGTFKPGNANLGGTSDLPFEQFMNALQGLPNVKLHGVLDAETLSVQYQRMDIFLICYDVNKDQSKGTNYHKVLEYLATGSVVVSNNISNYSNRSDLIQMVRERNHNANLPRLFQDVVEHLEQHNSREMRLNRSNYARENTYGRQISRIASYLDAIQKQNKLVR
jgi:glycosyltransferase involved in cell wall biosynthesis